MAKASSEYSTELSKVSWNGAGGRESVREWAGGCTALIALERERWMDGGMDGLWLCWFSHSRVSRRRRVTYRPVEGYK